ncbi:MAG: hypothetical protein Q4F28_02045 [Eubacteriales bacterium]|nr:hypothetical protein [Eubacteriales bacterium]
MTKESVQTISGSKVTVVEAGNPNREVKSSAFTSYYGVPENAADLYQALAHASDVDPQSIKYETLQGVLYLARKNDLAFTGDRKVLVVGEHQSTVNENMPLRSVIYYGRTMEKLIEPRAIYKSRRILIPTPEFYMFYNGKEPRPTEWTMNLSDAYLVKTDEPMLKLGVKVININPSAHHPILEECQTLYEYSCFMQEIRDRTDAGLSLDEAIQEAMEVCVKRGIMVEFIREHGTEVRNMLYTQFNLEDAKEVWEEEAMERGRTQGLEQGLKQGKWITLVKNIDEFRKNMNLSLEEVCKGADVTVEEYNQAKKLINR